MTPAPVSDQKVERLFEKWWGRRYYDDKTSDEEIAGNAFRAGWLADLADRAMLRSSLKNLGKLAEEEHARLLADRARLREALEQIGDMHLPDQPAASGGSEYDHAVRHIRDMRRIAKAALNAR